MGERAGSKGQQNFGISKESVQSMPPSQNSYSAQTGRVGNNGTLVRNQGSHRGYEPDAHKSYDRIARLNAPDGVAQMLPAGFTGPDDPFPENRGLNGMKYVRVLS